MDAWMENMIKKKEKKGKVTEIVTESLDNGVDPFEEYNRYIKQPWLIQDDCSNLISWWGVSNVSLFMLMHCMTVYFSISLNTQFST